MAVSLAVSRVAPRALGRDARRATASRRRIARGASKRPSEDAGKKFFDADLKKDLQSVDGGDYLDALRAGDVEAIAGTVGLLASVVASWSLWTLAQTGCGLPPGPGGALGALEGVSYLVVGGVVVGGTGKKLATGSGLPPGPGGVLGGAEGVSFLVALVGLGVLANQVFSHGFVPEAFPVEGGKCFGT